MENLDSFASMLREFADRLEAGEEEASISHFFYATPQYSVDYGGPCGPPVDLVRTGESIVIHRGKDGFPNDNTLLSRLMELQRAKNESRTG